MVSVLRFYFPHNSPKENTHEHSGGFQERGIALNSNSQAGGNSDPRHPTVCEHGAMKTTFAVSS